MWEAFFQVAVGLAIVIISVWANIDKRLSLKAKAQRRQLHRRRATDLEAPLEEGVEQVIQEESI